MRGYKGVELNRQPMLPYCQETYGAPYLHIHRADFHSVLVRKAEAVGVKSELLRDFQTYSSNAGG